MTSFDPQSRARPHIRTMDPYVPGTQPEGSGWIKLNTNELPYPCSPAVAAAVAAEVARLPLYPSPTSAPLRAAIAARHGLNRDQVIVGNGSDDILNMLFRVFTGNSHAAVATFPSYSLYPVLATIQNVNCALVPFDASMQLPVAQLCATGAAACFLTAPNAPTGVVFPLADIEQLLAAFDGVVIIDEAYADFASVNCLGLLAKYPNLVITRTFSKSFGLAGLRVGYALADPRVIELLDRVRDSYNVNRLSQAGALAALGDRAWLDDCLARVIATREAFLARLARRGWFTYPSQTNFVFTKPQRAGASGPAVAASLFEFFKAHKILVRYFGSSPLTDPFVRISIGTDAHMETVNATIDAWEANA